MGKAESELPIDNEARKAVLNTQFSFCVSAPAGSGKTELLTQRYLKLLASVDRPENILAITFTRKAAAEMRARIVDALKSADETREPEELHKRSTWRLASNAMHCSREKEWHLLENPSRLKIQTIDSLCQSIVSEQPVFSGMGGKLQPVENASSLYEEAIDRLLEELDSNSQQAEAIALLLDYLDNNVTRFKHLLMQMLPYRDQWLSHASVYRSSGNNYDVLEEVLRKCVEQAMEYAVNALNPYASDFALCADFAASYLSGEGTTLEQNSIVGLKGLASLPGPSQKNAMQWQAVVNILLTAKLEPRKVFDKRIGFPPKTGTKNKALVERSEHCKNQLKIICKSLSEDADALDALQTIAALPLAGYQPSQLALLKPLTGLLVHLCAHLNIVFGQHRRCDYNAVSAAALRALSIEHDAFTESSAAAYKWNKKLNHILIDEFQDTSVNQYALLRALTEDWQQHNVSEPSAIKTLFIVGDGMQSIYSFREANVGLFLRARESGVGELSLKSLALKQNFRSQPGIVNWVNHHFSQAFPSHINMNRGAVPYTDSLAFNHSGSETFNSSAVDIVALVDAPDKLAEAQEITRQIKQQQKKNVSADIAILVRARTHLPAILSELDQQEIAWEGVDIDPLGSRESVTDCITLTRAMCNLADDLAWYALLRGPLCGLRLTDLQIISDALSQSTQYTSISTLVLYGYKNNNLNDALLRFGSTDSQIRWEQFCERLQYIWQVRSQTSIRQWLFVGWLLLGGDNLAANGFSGDERSAVNDYFSLIEDIEQQSLAGGEVFSIKLLEQRVAKLFAQSGNKTAGNNQFDKRFSGSSNVKPVQIMTIHKSKGLEFDCVILPGLDHGSPPDSSPLLISKEYLFNDGSSGIMLQPQDKREPFDIDNRGKADTVYQHLRQEKKKALVFESTRLLYVAATRARSKLILLANLKRNDEGDLKAPSKGSLLEKLWPTLGSEIRCIDCSIESELNDEEDNHAYALLKRFNTESFHKVSQDYTALIKNDSHNGNKPSVIQSDNALLESQLLVKDERLQSRFATAVGTCCHEIFERIAIDGIDVWQNIQLKNLHEHWQNRLFDLGVELDLLSEGFSRVERAITIALNSDNGRWIFNSNHQHTQNEWQLSTNRYIDTTNTAKDLMNQTLTSRCVIDRAFIDKNNVRWVIDYKVTEPDPGQVVEAFILEQSKLYRPQLIQYAEHVALLDERENRKVQIKCGLYFPLIDHFEEVDF